MKAEVHRVEYHHFEGRDDKGIVTHFDSRSDGQPPQGASPVSVMLQSLASCTGIDVVDIIQKKRRQIDQLVVVAEGERAEEHPRVFTKVNLHFRLTSPDATEGELQRSIDLSQNTYCSISAMFSRSGCLITTSLEILRPDHG